MSLEKKRRELHRIEQDASRALAQNPEVALRALLSQAGLTSSPSLQTEADAFERAAAEIMAGAASQPFSGRPLGDVVAELQRALSKLSKPNSGFSLIGGGDVGPEPRTGERPRRWRVEGSTISLDVLREGRWDVAKQYRFDPERLGLAPTSLEALQRYQERTAQRAAQRAALAEMLERLRAAWAEHPARKVFDQYIYIDPDSPLSASLRDATASLASAEDVVDEFNRAAAREAAAGARALYDAESASWQGRTFQQAQGALSSALDGIRSRVKTGGLSPFALLRQGMAKPLRTAGAEVEQLEQLLGVIEYLWRNHPVRVRFSHVNAARIERGVAEPTDLVLQVERLDDLNRRAGVVASEYLDGHRSFASTIREMTEIRAELSAVPEAPSELAVPYVETCARVMAQAPRFTDSGRRELHIDSPELLATLAALEGEAWLGAQYLSPDDPRGVLANRQALRILREVGPDAEGIEIGQVLDGGGAVHGLDGRLYEIAPSGKVTLVASSADDEVIDRAASLGIPVG